jgi:hypothetical protein
MRNDYKIIGHLMKDIELDGEINAFRSLVYQKLPPPPLL